MKIKALLSLLLVAVMLFSLCGCSGGKSSSKEGEESAKVDLNSLVKEGSTPVEEGLDLEGKTITYAIGLQLNSNMQRQLLAFEKKYKCEVETDLLGYEDYVQLLASRMAGGKSYDIVQIEGVRFPSMAISNLAEPLEDVITSADWSGDDYTKGGLAKDDTLAMVWGDHLYAVVPVQGEFSAKVGFIVYNKKIFEAAGADDPRELYEAGKWNWDAFKAAGEKIKKNTDAYITGYRHIETILGYNREKPFDPYNPTSGLSDPGNIEKYNIMQELCVGNDPIVGTKDVGDHTASAFYEGKIAMFPANVYDLSDNNKLGEGVEGSNAFDKNLDNMGIVPHLQGPKNTEETYQCGWTYGIGAGKGTSDPRIAMAFAKHAATYATIDKAGTYKFNAEDTELINKLQQCKKYSVSHCFSDGSNIDYTLKHQFTWRIASGDDVAQAVATYDAQIQNCIDLMMAQEQ